MEVDEIQKQAFKFQRIGSSNGHGGANNIGHPDEEEGRVVLKRSSGGGGGGGNGMDILGGGIGGVARLCGWPSSSRIVRVSRASGGKDRHSKVLTSKGLRDRRVRLSVSTAIQFYDLQDRLGYDQPSKAVEWLIKAASSSIAELPSLNPAFSGTGEQVSDEKKSSEITEHRFESAEVEFDGDPNFRQQQQQGHSSTSETSKGSGLSLSRSENRIKARERARERAAEKEKEKENDSHCPISQNPSFTELLSAGTKNNNNRPNASGHPNSGGGGGGGRELDLVNKEHSQWTTSMDCLFAPTSSRGGQNSSGFLRHMNSLEPFTTGGDHHHQPEVQHFSFVPENLVPVATTAGESLSYNLNFSMSSSGLAGFNRGTLQSNSSPSVSHHPHLQRFNSIDGSNINMSFFNGSTASASNVTAGPIENHHQFPAGFKLCYGETPSGRCSDNHKGKGKH